MSENETQGLNPDAAPNSTARREPSDISVEALDLADYARTLARTNNEPYSYDGPAFRAFDNYPPTPPPVRPLASRVGCSVWVKPAM